jgi:hypothetical protein
MTRKQSRLAMNRILVTGALSGLFALVGCSNSTTASDSGVETSLSYMTPDAGEGGGGEAGDAAGDSEPVCVIPASATMVQQTSMGPVGCQPNKSAPFTCTDPTTFKLACSASDPSLIPPPPSALGCNLAPNGVGGAASLFYCCPCGM